MTARNLPKATIRRKAMGFLCRNARQGLGNFAFYCYFAAAIVAHKKRRKIFTLKITDMSNKQVSANDEVKRPTKGSAFFIYFLLTVVSIILLFFYIYSRNGDMLPN